MVTISKNSSLSSTTVPLTLIISEHKIFQKPFGILLRYSFANTILSDSRWLFYTKISFRVKAVELVDNRHSDVVKAWTAY